MQQEEIIAILERYIGELDDIISRFHRAQDGTHIDANDNVRYREIAIELKDLFDDEFIDGHRHSQPLVSFVNDSISNFFGSPSLAGVERVKAVVTSAHTRVLRNPRALKEAAGNTKVQNIKNADIIITLAERLHSIIRQLQKRRENRATLNVNDEYDVQDLFHVLLMVHFDDVRREEWAPSYAGSGSRMDFLLPEINTVVEIKMTRPSMSTQRLGDELIVDIDKYKKHPGCQSLVCVVYDPEGLITNPRGVENDLGKVNDQMAVQVMIVPK